MRNLRKLFYGLLAASFLLAVTCGSWEAHHVTSILGGTNTLILPLPLAPLWSPPSTPPYQAFRDAITDLPAEMPPGTAIRRIARYDDTLFQLIAYVGTSSLVCGIIYLATRRGRRDILLHYVVSVAGGFVSSVVLCIVVWLIFGGWAPPFPIFFGVLGIASGLLFALATIRTNVA